MFAFPSFINGALEAVEVQAAVLLVVPAGHGAPVVWVASPEELETADKLRVLSAEDGPPAAGMGGLPSETRGRIPENLVLSADESLADYIDQQGVGPGPVKLAQFRAALILRGAPALHSQDGKGEDALVHVKLFDPCGSASWYVMEWDGQEEAFGYVTGLGHDELGYFSLRELAETPGRLGIGIEIDTADPFWADDDNLYQFTCDSCGFGMQRRNLCFNRLAGPDLRHLRGELVNSMDDYGKAGDTGPDGSTWKVCGQECIDGVFYTFVARNAYGDKSKDPLMRQTSFNASLIKSTDRGRTWTRSAKAIYESPMWPGEGFGGPSFIRYGKNGGQVARDNAAAFVCVVSNNGFWNGGDGAQESSGSGDLAKAKPILSLPGKLGWTSALFIPTLNRYLLVAWHVTPTLKKWFEPGEGVYEFFEAERSWGPWNFVSSLNDRFLSQGHMYGPNLCAKYQERTADGVRIALFTSGRPFDDVPAGLYKMWRTPLVLKTRPQPHVTLVNDDHPSIRYSGNWQASGQRGCRGFMDDVHFSKTPGDAAQFTFTGTGVEWLSERYNDEGSAELFLDGQPRGRVELKVQDFPRLAQIPVFSAQGLADGAHTLRIVNTGTNYILVDAFSVTLGAAEVTVEQILSSPGRFDGTRVLVRGFFLQPMVGDITIHQTRPDDQHYGPETSIRLELDPQKRNLMPFQLKRCIVDGTFHAGHAAGARRAHLAEYTRSRALNWPNNEPDDCVTFLSK